MSQASDYLETALQDAIFNGGSISGITPYIALFTSDPADDATGTEVTGTGYARIDVSSSFPAASGTTGAMSNDADITFATAGGAWGSVTHVAIFDSSTSGNLLVYGALASAVSIANGDIFKIPVGSFTCTVA